jgi:acylphosphatase
MAAMIARHVFYEGRVQGIGFRYTVRYLAKGYEVVGWVRNLADGRVELLAGGQSREVEEFLQAIAESELAGFIKNIQSHPAEADALVGVSGFSIRG